LGCLVWGRGAWGVGFVSSAMGFGLPRRTVAKWVRRFRAEGAKGLTDRSSAPKRMPRRTSSALEQRVLALRRQRLVGLAIARQLQLPRSTVGAILRRHGLQRLKLLDPPAETVRYEREHPGEIVHLDTKKLARIVKVGHRIHGDRRRMRRGVGWEYAHIAIDDHSRLSYVEVLPDEKACTTVGFVSRALAFYERHGVDVQRLLTDNGSPYISRDFAELCEDEGLRHLRTQPYRPQTNGKAERMVQTLLREWAYVRAYHHSRQRTAALRSWLRHYNHRRPHGGIGYQAPISRIPKP
jgi:transposase InsO family protein